MSGIVDTLVSAAVGFCAGIVGSALTERLKAGVVEVQTELDRLNGLHDKLSDVLVMPTGTDRAPAARDAASIRRRIGINLRSLFEDSAHFSAVSALLSRIDKVLGKAEDGEALTPDMQTELDAIVLAMRRSLKARSLASRAWWIMRGR